MLAAAVRAARDWAALIGASEELELLVEPELDILTFFPAAADGERGRRARRSALFDAAAADGLHLSVLRVASERLHRRGARRPAMRASCAAS